MKNSLSVCRRLLLSERVPVRIPDKISDNLLRILIFLCVKCDLSLRVDQSVIVRILEDLSADRWMTLSWMVKKCGWWSEMVYGLKTATSSGIFLKRWVSCRFNYRHGISWVAERLLASQARLRSMQLVSFSQWRYRDIPSLLLVLSTAIKILRPECRQKNHHVLTRDKVYIAV